MERKYKLLIVDDNNLTVKVERVGANTLFVPT
jgi:hypothetical protein